MRFGGEEVAGARRPRDAPSRRAPRARAIVAARRQPVGQALDHGIDGERLERLGEVGEGLAQQAGQHRIVGHDLGHEGRVAPSSAADTAAGST